MTLLIRIAAAGLLLAGCSAAASSPTAEVEAGIDPIRDACSQALSVANSEASLASLTQCEVQNGEGGRVFVLQFDDSAENSVVEGLDNNLDTLFYQPLNALRPAWQTAEQDGDIATYVVAFRDSCQTVWEIDKDLMYGFTHSSMSAEDLTNNMTITSSTLC